MRRRDVSKVLLGSVAGSTLASTQADAQTCLPPCYPRTDAERDADVVPANTQFPPGDVRRFGAVANGTDQTSIVQTAIDAMYGAGVLGVNGGTVTVPMGVGVTLTGLTLRKNVTLVIDAGQHQITVTTGFNVSGAVNETWYTSHLHPAIILDARDDLTAPPLGAGQTLSYRCSLLWGANGTQYWQLAQDIGAVKSPGLTLYATNPSRQTMHWDHSGRIRYGRRSSVQDFSTPVDSHVFCKRVSIIEDSGNTVSLRLATVQPGVTDNVAAVSHQKTFELETDGELTLINDAGTGFPWRITDKGAMRTTQGISGGSFTTAQRNAFTGLVPAHKGLMVFDSSLGKPVWLSSVAPLVWVDAMGTVV